MYICAQNLTHIQTLINTRLFVRLFDYICLFVCHALFLYVYACAYICAHILRLLLCLSLFLLYTYIFNIQLRMIMLVMTIISTAHIQHSIENDDASDDIVSSFSIERWIYVDREWRCEWQLLWYDQKPSMRLIAQPSVNCWWAFISFRVRQYLCCTVACCYADDLFSTEPCQLYCLCLCLCLCVLIHK